MKVKTIIVTALLALLCAGALSAQVISQGQTVRKRRVAEESPDAALLDRAEAAIEKKEYAAAEPLLKEVVAKSPDNYTAWFDLGFVYNATGRTAESIDAYRKSVAAKPDIFESNLNLGLMLASSGRYPEAAKFLRAATQLKPSAQPDEGLARAWLSLGHVLAKTDAAEAVTACREAAKLRPKDPEPRLSAGQALEQLNDFAAAEKEYRDAQALDPSSPEPLAALSNLYMKAKRFPEAEAALRKYIGLGPFDGAAHVQLGRVLAAEGKNEEALKEFEWGMQGINLGSPTGNWDGRELAALYETNKKYDQAAAQYKLLLQQNPDDPELHRALGSALLHGGQFAEAQAELQQAVKLKPDFGEAWGELALAASDNKNYPLTIQALEARAKYLPEVPGTIFLRATAYDHLRDYKQAAALYHQFLAVSNGRYPDQEWQARHRLIAIEPKKK
jgi:tetratricopeptide (TPR) repeat protein